MPAKTPIHPDCIEFGAKLHAAFASVNLTDPKQIGELVAAAQEYPERETIPYHPAVVEAWFSGEALPESNSFEAILSLLSDTNAIGHLEYAHELASLNPPSASEISVVMKHRMQEGGFILATLSKALYDLGCKDRKGNAYNEATISQWRSGINPITPSALPPLDKLLTAAPEEPTLARLSCIDHPPPGFALAKAAGSTNIHAALRHVRNAMQMSRNALANEIGAYLPDGKTITGAAINQWESEGGGSVKSTIPSRSTFTGTDAMTVYGQILTDHGHGEWWQQTGENIMRRLLDQEIHRRGYDDTGRATSARPLQPIAAVKKR
ncbi:MAG: hypothetical protein K2X09_07520 [Rickettsiales bacterium]|nr:hypothetical protein [Rickettsiales bacterium]